MDDDTDHDRSDGKLIVVAFGTETTVRDKPLEQRFCRHHQYLVDEAHRTVTCGQCGALIDAFEVLLEYANKERHWRQSEAEERKVTKRISELEEQERRIKARTRSARRKDADHAVEEERVRVAGRLSSAAHKVREIERLAGELKKAIGAHALAAAAELPTCDHGMHGTFDCWQCRTAPTRHGA